MMLRVCGKEINVTGKVIRVAQIEGEGYQSFDNINVAVDEVRNSKTRVDIFTFIQTISDNVPRYPYMMEWDNFAVLRVSTFEHWMKNQIDFKVRNKVRKAEKSGISVREVPFDDNLVKGIHAIYNETPTRQGRAFPHYGDDIETIRRTKSTWSDRAIFIGAFLKDELIGFIKLVSNEDHSQAGLMHILSLVRERDKAPTNALIAQAVRSCADRKIPNLWYANFAYGNKEGGSLADFKRYNGFEKVDIPRFYVPLTAAGRLALKLNLHHGLTEIVPEPIAASYRKVRGAWYNRKYSEAKSGK